MLDGAAATDAEMRTERLDPFWACDIHREQLAAVGMMAQDVIDLDCFAAECVGHIDRFSGIEADAVAATAPPASSVNWLGHRPEHATAMPRFEHAVCRSAPDLARCGVRVAAAH